MIDVQNTKLDGVKIIKVRRYCDNRGFFKKTLMRENIESTIYQ